MKQKKKNLIQILNNLPSYLNTLFKVLLSSNDEPLLLTGNTCYKTFLAEEYLDHYASVVSLNQETSIEQLLGSSKLFNKNDAKEFYLIQLCNCIQSNKTKELLSLLKQRSNEEKKIKENKKMLDNPQNNIKEKKNLKKIIDDDIKDLQNPTFKNTTINILYKKLFDEENEKSKKDNNNLISGMITEFRPGLFLSAILGKKSLILKNFPNAKSVVLERFNELFSGKHCITLYEDIYDTFTQNHCKELKTFDNSFRIIATCHEGYEKRLSEALLSRFTIIYAEPYSNQEQKEVLYMKIKKNTN